jgi:hypothetical protein
MNGREIKFRAIDKNTGEWVYSEKIGLDVFFTNVCLELYSTRPEQFIGFNDSKGCEIYEGDKVRVPSIYGNACHIKIIELETLYSEDGDIGIGFYWPSWQTIFTEWVGTIHEKGIGI